MVHIVVILFLTVTKANFSTSAFDEYGGVELKAIKTEFDNGNLYTELH